MDEEAIRLRDCIVYRDPVENEMKSYIQFGDIEYFDEKYIYIGDKEDAERIEYRKAVIAKNIIGELMLEKILFTRMGNA